VSESVYMVLQCCFDDIGWIIKGKFMLVVEMVCKVLVLVLVFICTEPSM